DGSWQYFADYFNGVEKRNPAETNEQGSPANYPVFDGTIEPFDGNIKVTEDDLVKIAVCRSKLANEAAEVAQMRWQKAKQSRTEIEQELHKLQTGGQVDKTILDQLNNRLKVAIRTEEESRLQANDANKESDRAEFMTQKGELVVAAYKEERKKRMEDQTARQEPYKAHRYDQSLPLTENYAAANQPDLILTPPQEACM